MPNQLSRRTLLAALVAAVPSAALARVVGAQAPATPPAPPQPMTGPVFGAPPTDFKPPYPEAGKVNRLDPRLDVLMDADAKVEKICDGFLHAEGPVWVGGANGYLLTSDTQVNHIVKWSPTEGRSVWLETSGYDVGGVGWAPNLREPGTNGLILGRGGLIAAGSGARSILRIDLATKKKTVLVDQLHGKAVEFAQRRACSAPTAPSTSAILPPPWSTALAPTVSSTTRGSSVLHPTTACT